MGESRVRLGYQVPKSSEPLFLTATDQCGHRGSADRMGQQWLGKGHLESWGQAGIPESSLKAPGSGEGWSATLPRTRGRYKSETTGDIVSVQQVLLK